MLETVITDTASQVEGKILRLKWTSNTMGLNEIEIVTRQCFQVLEVHHVH